MRQEATKLKAEVEENFDDIQTKFSLEVKTFKNNLQNLQ